MNVTRERAVASCQAVCARAARSREHVSALVEEVHVLSRALDETQVRIEARRSELASRMGQGGTPLRERGQDALAGFARLHAKRQELGDQIQAMLSRVRRGLAELDELHRDMLQQVESQATQKTADLASLAARTEALRRTAEAHLDLANRRIESFRDDCVAARDDLRGTKERLEQELVSLEARAKGAVEGLAAGADALIAAGETAFERLSGDLDALADQAVLAVGTRIGESIVGRLEEQVRPLERAFASLEELVARGEASLRGELAGILERNSEVSATIGTIEPVLDTIERLLSARANGGG